MDKIILAVGDTHFPFSRDLSQIYCITKILQPDYIIQLGDLYDCFSHSKFPKKIKDPLKEIEEGRMEADIFWDTMKEICPKAEKYQIKGNHDIRPKLRLIEKCPEVEMFYDDKWLWKFDGVNTIYDSKEVLFVEKIAFIHGWKSKLGDHAKFFMCNTVCGHSHRGGVVSFNDIRRNSQPIWELNAGYTGNPLSVPFSYPATKFTHWTYGIGLIDSFGPRFVHLP